MLNQVCIAGRLTRDPELRFTNSGIPVASFRIACERSGASRNGEQQTDFLNCSAWRNTAEFVNKHFKKSSMIIIHGCIQAHEFEKDGERKVSIEILARDVYFGDYKKPAVSESAEEDEEDEEVQPLGLASEPAEEEEEDITAPLCGPEEACA